MAFNMMVWENRQGNLVELPKKALDREERLESWLEADSSLLGADLLIIGRQVCTPYGGRIDLLAIDARGDVVIIEAKRDRTPREVVAQTIDYASWVASLSTREVVESAEEYFQKSGKKSLEEMFRDRFDAELPEALNTNHHLLIVASELDDSSERIVQYLSSRHGLNINVVFFTCFEQDGRELIGRSWLMDPQEVEERSDYRVRAPWTGYWFVNVGEGQYRNWDDCRKYGFIAAGKGPQAINDIRKLKPGDRIFAYMKGLGYVGFGAVAAEAVLAKDFIPAGEDKPLCELPLEQPGVMANADDPNLAEWAVRVDWKKTYPRDQAQTFDGRFANQHIVCKLRHPQTLSFLMQKFEVSE